MGKIKFALIMSACVLCAGFLLLVVFAGTNYDSKTNHTCSVLCDSRRVLSCDDVKDATWDKRRIFAVCLDNASKDKAVFFSAERPQ